MAETPPEGSRVKAPPGTCDCHMHVYGPQDKYKVAPTSPWPAIVRTAADYRKVMQELGIQRVVVVQPTAYARDNSCTLDAVDEIGRANARAVVIVDQTASDAELDRLTGAGARGIRFHMLQGGVLGWDIIDEMSARVRNFGWHVQLQLDGRLLPEKEAIVRRLPSNVVIDHTGKFLEPVKTDDPAFKALLGLVDTGRVWVKLSAPYETSRKGPPDYADVGDLARALIARAPERMLWATNWPHPSAQANPPSNRSMLDMLGYWCPDEATRNRILAANPATVYGFA
jgi:D-galactarolactone isomerase